MIMMDYDKKFIDYVYKLSTSVEPVSGHRLAAAIVYKNELIATGICQYKTHPLMGKYGKNSNAVFLHAEIDAIKNSLRILSIPELNKSTIFIARARKNPSTFTCVPGVREDVWGSAKPCIGCQMAINSFGLKRVVCTTDHQGEILVY